MSMSNTTSILVVDDDIQIQRAIRVALAARNYNVLLASNGEEALDLTASFLPNLITLDLNLPGKSGIDVCKEIRTWSQVPIIVLSIRGRENDKITALDAGADDYITKPFTVGELLARIRAQLRRMKQIPTSEASIETQGLIIDIAAHRVTKDHEEIKLTKTEFAILQYLAKNSGRVITYNLLISELWGTDFEGDTRSLRVHIANLRNKIERNSNYPQFIITEPGVGYRFVTPDL